MVCVCVFPLCVRASLPLSSALQHQVTAATLSFVEFKRELAEYFATLGHGAARPPGEKVVANPEEMSFARPVREARFAFALLVRERWVDLQGMVEEVDKDGNGQVRVMGPACDCSCFVGGPAALVVFLGSTLRLA